MLGMIDRPLMPVPDDGEEPCDLAERLANYRSRVAREGRKSAVERLDRAIDEARRTGRRTRR
jgi:hypothetical protein